MQTRVGRCCYCRVTPLLLGVGGCGGGVVAVASFVLRGGDTSSLQLSLPAATHGLMLLLLLPFPGSDATAAAHTTQHRCFSRALWTENLRRHGHPRVFFACESWLVVWGSLLLTCCCRHFRQRALRASRLAWTRRKNLRRFFFFVE